MTRPGFAFSTTMKVRYAEIDGQKVVFNSRYLEYVDVAVTEYWEWAGQREALADEDWESHVRRTELDYLKPFVLGDTVEVFAAMEAVGTTSFRQRFELVHADTGVLHAVAVVTGVGVDLKTGRPLPHSAAVRAFLEGLIPPR